MCKPSRDVVSVQKSLFSHDSTDYAASLLTVLSSTLPWIKLNLLSGRKKVKGHLLAIKPSLIRNLDLIHYMKGMLATFLFYLRFVAPTMDFCFWYCCHTFGTTIWGNVHCPFSTFSPKEPDFYVQGKPALSIITHSVSRKIISHHQYSCQVTHLELSLSLSHKAICGMQKRWYT